MQDREAIAKYYQDKKTQEIQEAIDSGVYYETDKGNGYVYKGKVIEMEIRTKPTESKTGLYGGKLPPWHESLIRSKP